MYEMAMQRDESNASSLKRVEADGEVTMKVVVRVCRSIAVKWAIKLGKARDDF